MTPQGWQEKTLGDICVIGAGNSAPQDKDLFENGIYPFFRTADVGKIHFGKINSSEDLLNEKGIKGLKLFKKGTILIPKSGASTFLNHRVKMEVDGFVVSHLATVKGRENVVNDDFLLYYLLTIKVQDLIQDQNYPSVNLPIISNIKIMLPPLPEQERIVAKLDKAFEAIDKVKANAEQNLTNTKELFESYLNNIFSNINASFNKKLSDVTKIVGGGTPSKSTPTYYQGNIPWATVRDMNEDDLSKTEFSITNEAVKSSATNIIPANNVIIATRVGLGKVCILMQDTAINQDLKGIIPTKPMNFKYLFWWFKSIKNKIEEAGVGATVKGVKLPFVQNLQIPYISINDQQKIVEKLDALQEQTKRLEQIYTQKIKECDELKQSILQKAFRGEL